ncbi:MAG TPA: UvrD-helicase domain-containing protein [Solimonas sp.]
MSTAPLSDARARAEALDLSQHVLTMAPAGSGKTGLLVGRLLRALAVVDEPEQVVAITFTNKAAAEIRHRAIGLLRQAREAKSAPTDAHLAAALADARAVLARDAERNWQLLEQPERLRATTIDAFCAQLAAQLPLLSGLGGRVAIAEDAWPLYAEAVMRLVAELEDDGLSGDDREALRVVLRLADNRIDRLLPTLADLLQRREQWLPMAAGEIPASAGDDALLRRLVHDGLRAFDEALDPALRTELADLLREGSGRAEPLAWAAFLRGWPAPEPANLALYRRLAEQLVTRDGTLRSARGINVRGGFGPGEPHTLRMKALLAGLESGAQVEAATAHLLRLPDPDYPAALQALRQALLRVMRRLAAHLIVVFGERGQTDFAQIAQAALAALRPDGDYGDALLSADRQIRHLLVDEMQDTSEAQVALLRQLTSGWQPGDGRSLFLVGDPQQSIYAFRKAEVRLFLELWEQQALGELPLHCVRLAANFRSRPAVVDWFNAAFQRIFPTQADAALGIVPFAPSLPQRAASDDSGVEVVSFGEDEDARAAEQAAADAERLIALGSVAILGRTRSHLAPVIRALRARGLTPACQDIDPLATQPAVRDVVALARALWHPEDRLHWAVLLRAPFVGLSWADLVALSRGQVDASWPQRLAARADDATLSDDGRARVARLLDALARTAAQPSLRADLAERTEAVWYALNGPACLAPGELADVQAALQLLRAQARDGGIADVEALDRGLARLYAQPRAGQIQVMTVHKAKGLEFDHVLLLGLDRKPRAEDQPLWHLRHVGTEAEGGELLVPKPPDALAEDDPAHRLYGYVHREHVTAREHEALRLLYVAVTRARQTLRLYVCAARDAEGAPRFDKGSFAQLLSDVIAPDIGVPLPASDEDPATPAAVAREAQPPRTPRLPPDARLPLDPDVYRPVETRTLRPSESVLNAVEDKREAAYEAEDLEAQLIGTLYHQALERIAETGVEHWQAGDRRPQLALAAGFQRLGLATARIPAAVARVGELVQRTLDSDDGRWLLAPKPWARNEYHLAGWSDGRWVAAVIDRCFEDEDGTLWIVDYKAAARALPDAARAGYADLMRERYGAQLGHYAQLLGKLRPQQRIRTALYLAETARLIPLDGVAWW